MCGTAAGENPYLDILAAADGLCATADSVNMISEACAAGKSVCLLPMLQKGGWRAARAAKKFSRFHSEIVGGGWAKFWPAPPFWRNNESNPARPIKRNRPPPPANCGMHFKPADSASIILFFRGRGVCRRNCDMILGGRDLAWPGFSIINEEKEQ